MKDLNRPPSESKKLAGSREGSRWIMLLYATGLAADVVALSLTGERIVPAGGYLGVMLGLPTLWSGQVIGQSAADTLGARADGVRRVTDGSAQ